MWQACPRHVPGAGVTVGIRTGPTHILVMGGQWLKKYTRSNKGTVCRAPTQGA